MSLLRPLGKPVNVSGGADFGEIFPHEGALAGFILGVLHSMERRTPLPSKGQVADRVAVALMVALQQPLTYPEMGTRITELLEADVLLREVQKIHSRAPVSSTVSCSCGQIVCYTLLALEGKTLPRL